MNLEELTVFENETLKVAMEKMDKSGRQIIYIINDQENLSGVLSDGDVRRWILKENGNIQKSVKLAMNNHPFNIRNLDQNTAKDIMNKHNINSVPVINDDGKLVSIIFNSDEIVTDTNLDIPVVIMAGGKGTRLYPYTKIIPKPLIPIGDVPIMERIMNKFSDYGMNDFLISVNYKKNMIKSYFDDINHPFEIKFIEEEKPLGTAGSLSLMKGSLHSQFFVSNCDILVNTDYGDIVNFHDKNKYDITIIASLKNDQIPYGVLQLDKDGLLESTEEKPEFSYLVNTGMYLINNNILEYIPENTAIDLPTVIMTAKEDGKKVGVYPVSENSWLDMGQIKEMENMIERLGVD